MDMNLINRYGNIIKDLELFTHFHDVKIKARYDSNFILLKNLPTLHELIELENYLRGYHHSYGQNHLKFIFPPNKKIPNDLTSYIKNRGYDEALLEMYSVFPNEFQGNLDCTNVCFVTEENLEDFLELQYMEDLRFGLTYANEKVPFLKSLFLREDYTAAIIYEGNEAVGSVELIIKSHSVEIDNLFIKEPYRKKGYATRLQAFVMKNFSNKQIILVADGEDTPKQMYQKQGYKLVGFQYEILKIGFI